MKHLQKLGYIAIGSVLTLAVMGTALAATGALTIEVNPINVQVNGQTFQPKDSAGKTVSVFAYNGTTYAPLRALAEAYGLKVGYDAATNMATVGETTPTKTPDKPAADYSTWTAEEEKAYQEFKGMWEVEFTKLDEEWDIQHYNAHYVGKENASATLNAYKKLDDFALRFAEERFENPHQVFFGFIVENSYIGSAVIMFQSGLWSKNATMSP